MLLDRLDRLSAAAATCESSELMLSSSVTVPVVAARRRPKLPPTTLMLTAPGGSWEALATTSQGELKDMLGELKENHHLRLAQKRRGI